MVRPRSCLTVLLSFTVFAAGTSAQTKSAAKEAQSEKDLYGDPLPEMAMARFGTIRFRHEGDVSSVAFSSNGKILAATSNREVIYLWDAASGKQLGRLPMAPNNQNPDTPPSPA